jgi:hypothetical protein
MRRYRISGQSEWQDEAPRYESKRFCDRCGRAVEDSVLEIQFFDANTYCVTKTIQLCVEHFEYVSGFLK